MAGDGVEAVNSRPMIKAIGIVLAVVIIGPIVFVYVTGPLFTIVCGGWMSPFEHDAMRWCLNHSIYSW